MGQQAWGKGALLESLQRTHSSNLGLLLLQAPSKGGNSWLGPRAQRQVLERTVQAGEPSGGALAEGSRERTSSGGR